MGFSDADFDGLVLHFFISTSKFKPINLYNKLQQGLDDKNKRVSIKSNLSRQISKAWGLEKENIIVYGLDMMDKTGNDMNAHIVEMQLAQSIKLDSSPSVDDGNKEGMASPTTGNTITNGMRETNGAQSSVA